MTTKLNPQTSATSTASKISAAFMLTPEKDAGNERTTTLYFQLQHYKTQSATTGNNLHNFNSAPVNRFSQRAGAKTQ
jgi:hypothetical protein